MKRYWLSGLILLALLAGAAGVANLAAQPAAAPRPTHITSATRLAVCDIVEVFDNYQRARDLTQQLEEKSRQIEAENGRREQAIRAIQAELQSLKPGSAEYEKRLDEIQKLTIDRKAWLDFETAKNMRNHHRLTKEMYEEIVAVVAQVAKELTCQLVIQRDRSQLKSENTPELIRRISALKVIYAAPEVDMTEVVLQRLNMAYRAKKTP